MNDENLKRTAGPGRKKGIPNRTTTQMREMILQIVNNQLEDVETALEEILAEDKVQYIKLTTKLMEMVLPKQQEIALSEVPKIDIEATLAKMAEQLKE